MNLMSCFCTVNRPKFQSFQGFHPKDPHHGSAPPPWTAAGAYCVTPNPAVQSSDRWLSRIVPLARYGQMHAVHTSLVPFFFCTNPANFLYALPKIDKPAQNRKKCLKTRPKITNSSGLLHRGVVMHKTTSLCFLSG